MQRLEVRRGSLPRMRLHQEGDGASVQDECAIE